MKEQVSRTSPVTRTESAASPSTTVPARAPLRRALSAIGNLEVQRILAEPVVPVRAKLYVGGPRDVEERAAEHNEKAFSECACAGSPEPCERCRKARRAPAGPRAATVQRSAAVENSAEDGQPALSPEAAARLIRLARGAGPLPRALRAPYERFFGRDLGHVAVRRDGQAQRAARGLGARAFTLGDTVFFGAGEFRPESPRGQALLAHELTHTLAGDARAEDVAAETKRVAAEPTAEPAPEAGREPSGTIRRNGPIGPIDPQLTMTPEERERRRRVEAFKNLIRTVAVNRLANNKKNLQDWSVYIRDRLPPAAVERLTSGVVWDYLHQTAAATGAEHVARQWEQTSNPALRFVQEQQIHGRFRACTGCHATVQADSWARQQAVRWGREWQTPRERREAPFAQAQPLAGPSLDALTEFIRGATPGGTAPAAGTGGSTPQAATPQPASGDVSQAFRQLGPEGYQVLPTEVFSSLSGKSNAEIVAIIQAKIAQRSSDYDELSQEIASGDFEYVKLRPILDAFLPLADPDVRRIIEEELESAETWETVKNVIVGVTPLVLLLIPIVGPALGASAAASATVAEVGLLAYGGFQIVHGAQMFLEGQSLKRATGARDVVDPALVASADEMMMSGLLMASFGVLDAAMGGMGLAARLGGRPPGSALARTETTGVEPFHGRTVSQGDITVTISRDGAMVATHAADPSVMIVVRNGEAVGYRMTGRRLVEVGRRPWPPAAGAPTAGAPAAGAPASRPPARGQGLDTVPPDTVPATPRRAGATEAEAPADAVRSNVNEPPSGGQPPARGGAGSHPETLTHYDLSLAEARESFAVSIRADASREAAIWFDTGTRRYAVVQGNLAFTRPPTSAGLEAQGHWMLITHWHPYQSFQHVWTTRLPSARDFRAMMRPQLEGLRPHGPVESQVHYPLDPDATRLGVSRYGYDPVNHPDAPYWVQWFHDDGTWHFQRFQDPPWEPNSDYENYFGDMFGL